MLKELSYLDGLIYYCKELFMSKKVFILITTITGVVSGALIAIFSKLLDGNAAVIATTITGEVAVIVEGVCGAFIKYIEPEAKK